MSVFSLIKFKRKRNYLNTRFQDTGIFFTNTEFSKHWNFRLALFTNINLNLFGDLGKMVIPTAIKKLSIAMAGAALMVMGIAGAAQAASFGLSYPLVKTNNVLSGILSGDVQPDGNTVIVSSVIQASLNNVAGPTLPYVAVNDGTGTANGGPTRTTVSFSGVPMHIAACTNSSCTDGFYIRTSDRIAFPEIYLYGFFDPSNGSISGYSELYDFNRFQLTPVSEPASVPEPTSTLSLLAIGAIGAGLMFKRKQQQKVMVKEWTKP